MSKRIECFDGLKGFSAIIVMLTHFAICFSSISWLQRVPVVGLLFDGGLAVYVFVILSSFGMCCSLANSKLEDAMAKVSLKRYFRLTLPLVLPSVLAFLVSLTNFNYCSELGTMENNEWTRTLVPQELHLNQLTSGIFVGVLRGSALINPMWMMKYIFLGSFLVLPFFYLSMSVQNKIVRYACLLFFAVAFYSTSPYYTAIFMGILLFHLKDALMRMGNMFSILLLVLLIALHAYDLYKTQFIGGALLICVVLTSPIQRNLFSSKLFVRLNKLSYQLYLVHASVLASFCSWFYMNISKSYTMLACNLLLFFVLTFAISYAFTNFDVRVSSFMEKVYKKILK